MYLAKSILENFVESLDEETEIKLAQLDQDQAFEYLSSIYEEQYGKRPAGAMKYLIQILIKEKLYLKDHATDSAVGIF